MTFSSLPASLWHLAVENYRNWLVQQGLSPKTVENYISDLRRWLSWLDQRPGKLSSDLTAAGQAYLEDLIQQSPESTVNRRTAAMRRFGEFLLEHSALGWSLRPQLLGTAQTVLAWQEWIHRFAIALVQAGCKQTDLQNLTGDVELFLSRFQEVNLEKTLTKYEVAKYLKELTDAGISSNDISATKESLHRFGHWLGQAGFLRDNPLQDSVHPTLEPSSENNTQQNSATKNLDQDAPASTWWSRWYSAYHRLPFTTALHLVILVVFASLLSMFAYRQFVRDVSNPFAYPSSPVRPNRQLSFQGRLTDSVGTPITTATNVTFTLHDASTLGNELWNSGACSIDPDQDGIFSTNLGDTCGSEIPEDVFSELADVWLQLQVGAEVLSPRQPINTVPYALNTETVQGFPVSLSGTINTIPVINALGQMIIGANNPSIVASSGAFLIQGESLVLQTEAGGDITLNPGTGGTIELEEDTNVTGDLSASGTITFSGLANGLVRATSGVLSGGNTVSLTTDISGILPIANGGTNANSIGSAGSVAYSTGSAYAFSAVGTTGQCLVSNGSSAPSWSTCLTSVSEYWSINNGALSPTNQTTDLLLGATATSGARFAFLNVLTGTPTASISAGTAGATYLRADGVLSTTARQNLLLGNSVVANTTGDVLLQSNGAGRVGIGTATPGELLSIYDGNIEFIGNNTLAGVVLSNDNYDFRISNAVSTADVRFWSYLDDVYFDNTYNGAMIFRNDTDGTADERFRVSANGNFGIGDNSPSALFTVGNGDLFQVNSSGAIAAVQGITNTGTITSTGGTISLNASSNFATNINTGTSNGAVSIGGGSATVAVNSTSWDISTAGVASGFTGITSSGTITFSGLANGLVRATSGVLSGGNTVALTSDVSGILPIANGGTNANSIGSAGTIAYSTGTAYAFSAVGTTGQCLVSNGSSAPSWSTCLTSVSEYWNINNGALSPTNQTTDLLVGGAGSASAKFAVLNVLTGTPTASVSAGTSGATYMTAAGNIQTTANQNLTIGGNTTGNITLSPLNGSGRVNSTGDLNLSSGKAYLINGTSVLNATTLGSSVTTSSLTTVGALSSGSITSGFGTIATANTITGTTLNGTTGLNTGAGAGTQRIDASGNLLNIGNITATGALQNTGTTTLAGGVTSINDSSNFNTNINTGTSTGAVAIGGGSGTLAINTTSWDISSAGVASGFTGITSSGTITFSSLADGLVRATSGVLSGGNTVALTSEVSGVLPIANGGTNSTATPTQGGLAYGTGTAYAFTAAGSNGECLKSNGTSAPTWGSCTTGVTEYWSIAAGALRPLNATTDLLVGGSATSSAKFALTNVDSGTPTFIINDGVDFTSFSATGRIDSSSNITVYPSLGGGGFIIDGYANLTTGNTYRINNNPVISATTLGSGVVNSSLTSTGSLTSGSIASGFGTITTANTITGTTINGTTGLNTGAGAGTQRLDASGNLVNIGDITASGTITFSGLASGVVKANGSGVLSGGNAVSLTSDITGILPIANGGTNSTATPTAGTIAYGTGTAYAFSAVGTTGQCLVSNGALAPSWSTCLTSVSEYWNINAGALSPTNLTTDLLVGGSSTTSAKFAFINVTAGSPTASISAGTSGALTLNANGTIGTTARQDLVLGNTTTGNLTLAPAGSTAMTVLQNGNVGIGDTNPGVALNVLRTAQSDITISTNTNVGAGNAALLSFISDADGTPSYASLGQYGTSDLRFSGAGNLVAPDAILTAGGSFGVGGDLTPNSLFSVGSTSQFQVNSSGAVAAATGITSSGTITFSGLTNGIVKATSGVLSGGNTVTLTSEVSGILPIANGGTNSTATPTQGGVAYGTGTAYAFTTAGSSGQCFLSNGTSAPSWGSCLAGITDYWTISNGALSTVNPNTDMLVGGDSTASAKFAVLNVTAGTPTASISAGTNGATYITAAGTIQSTRNQNMTIGGNTTGHISLQPLNGSGQVRVPAGSVTSGPPGLAFNSYTDTGIAANGDNFAIWESGTLALNLTAHSSYREFRVPSNFRYAFASSTTNTTGSDTEFSRLSAGNLYTPGNFIAAGSIGIGDTSPASALTVGSGDLFEVNSSGTITDVRGITNTGAITSTGAAISLNASSNFAVDIATGTSTGTVTLGGTGTQTISIGNGAGVKTVNLGSSNTTSTTTLLSGSGGLYLNQNNSAPTYINADPTNSSQVTIAGGTGVLVMGGGNTAQTIQIGTGGGAKSITIGSTNSTSQTDIQGGSVGVRINSGVNSPTLINDGSSTGAITLGGGSGTVAVNSTSWDISTAGVASGFTGITSSGTITFSGLANGIVKATSGVLSGGNTASLTTDVSGILPIANGGTNSTATPTNGGVAYGTGTAFAFTAAGSSGECFLSNGVAAPTWGSCSSAVSGSIPWQITNGAANLKNTTIDLLVGGSASSSAKFAVLNVLTGTPTASVSAGASGATYVTATGTLATTAGQDLSFAPSGSIQAVITNGGRLGVGTSAPASKLHSLATTEQLRLGYDTSNYAQFTVQSNGDLNINSVASSGTPKISLADNVQIATGNVLDVTGDVRFTFGTDLMSINEELRVTYSPTVYSSFATNSFGVLTIDPVGAAPSVTIDSNLSVNGTASIQDYLFFANAGPGYIYTVGGPLVINDGGTDGITGIGTNDPYGALEVNHSTGLNLRLTYNDMDGSATNYTDFNTTSGGDLTIAPSGSDVNITGSLSTTGNINTASGQEYRINGTSVLNATTLGSGVVNSSLTSVGTLTGLTVNGTTTINDSNSSTTSIGTGTSTGAVTIGGTGTQTVSIANGAGAKTLNLGSSNTTSTTTILSGSGALNLNAGNSQTTNINTGSNTGTVNIGNGSSAQTISIGGFSGVAAKTVSIGSGNGFGGVTLQGGSITLTGTVSINDSQSTVTTNIGTGTSDGAVTIGGTGTQTVSIANGAGVKTLNLGSSNTTSTTTILSGSGGLNLNVNNNQATNIGTGTTTGTITLGGTGTQSIDIGTGAGVKTVNLGSSNTTSTTTILSGSGGLNLNVNNNQATNIGTGTTTGTITLGGTGTQSIDIGTGAGVKTVNLGSSNTTSTTNITAGSGHVNISTTGTGNTNIGNATGGIYFPSIASNTTARTICINNTTGLISKSVDNTGCTSSSIRYKDDVNNLSYGLEALMQLRPVFYRYKASYDTDTSRKVGFVAEEVAAVVPELGVYNENGTIEGVAYAQVSALNTKAIQELAGMFSDFQGNTLQIDENTGEARVTRLKADEAEVGQLKVIDSLGSENASITSQGAATFRSVIAQEMSSRFIATESILVTGDATVEGTLIAQSARIAALEAQGLNAETASISGTLRADRLEGIISAESVEGLEARIAALVAAQTASESGTPETDPETQGEIETLSQGSGNGELVILPGDLSVLGLISAEGGISTPSLLVDSTSLTKNELSFATEPDCNLETGCNSFAFQPSGIGALSFLNNLVVMTDGTVAINGDLAVSGTVTAEQVQTDRLIAENNALTIDLAASQSAQSGDVLGSLIIRGTDNREVANYSADGSARFQQLKLNAQNAAPQADNQDQSEQLDSSSGTATLKAGKTEFKIRTSATKADSLVYLTATSATENKVLFVKAQGDGEFTVGIESGIGGDISFNWWVVGR